MVILLAVVAACLYALSSICQRLGVETVPGEAPATNLAAQIVHRRVWLLGFVVMAGGYAIQAVALHLGSVVVVQPLMVSELLVVVLLLWFWYDRPWGVRDVVSVLGAVAGLAVFLAVAAPSAGTSSASTARWVSVSAIAALLALVCVILGLRGPDWWRALALGTGASVGFAYVAVVTKSLSVVLTRDWAHLLEAWQFYDLVVVGLAAFVVMQYAFRVGSLAISQAALILVNPIVSIVLGVALYHETLRAGTLARVTDVASLVVLIASAISLCASPSIVGVYDEDSRQHLLAGRGRYARRHARQDSSTPGSRPTRQ